MQPNDQNQDLQQQPQNTATNDPVVRRVIQPLSSEQDILQEAQAQPSPLPAREPVQPHTTLNIANPASNIPQGNANSAEDYPSTLVTEPLRPQLQNASPLNPQPKKSGKKILITILCLAVIATAGLGAYHLLSGGNSSSLIPTLPASNLEKETAGNTSYLRPKEWKQTTIPDTISAYSEESTSTPSSFIGVNEGKAATTLKDAEDKTYDKVRELLVSRASVSLMQSTFSKNGIACTSEIDFKVEPDTKKTGSTRGMMITRGTCTHSGGEFTIKVRTVIGQDGRTRVITIGASNDAWVKDQKTFDSILDSIQQI